MHDDQLCQFARAAHGLYATIDLAALRDSASKALQFLKTQDAVCLLGDLRQEAQLASPWLVRLTAEPSAALNWSLELARRHSAVTWLSTSLDTYAMAGALDARMDARLPDGEDVLLRCFDPRVLAVLPQVLDEQQRASFFNLGCGWHYLGRSQTLETIEMQARAEQPPLSRPLRLSDRQFAQLLDAAEIDAVMPELVNQAPDIFSSWPAAERFRFTRTWLDRGRPLGLHQYPDRVALCVLALRLGPGFDARPPWAERLARVARGELSFEQMLTQSAEDSQ